MFRANIDLIDETLREGGERSPISASVEEKVDMAVELSDFGVRSIVVGMFPDVPQNIDLLSSLIIAQKQNRISKKVRFLIISHVGEVFKRTLKTLEENKIPLDSVWIIAIHSVSDLQIQYLFPRIAGQSDAEFLNQSWREKDVQVQREQNLKWFSNFLAENSNYNNAQVMVGLLDAFRADRKHLSDAIRVCSDNNVKQVRLVDTAGTCIPQQIESHFRDNIEAFPHIDFYGHFHNDFGLATANAMLALACGAKGVDVSIGGFANRAGHPPLAEVLLSLKKLYNQDVSQFKLANLSSLSRKCEKVYGLCESPTQAITGHITHGVSSGIRTELQKEAPEIFDVINPEEVGIKLRRTFGARSGRDGIKNLIKSHASTNQLQSIINNKEFEEHIYQLLQSEWQNRGSKNKIKLQQSIADYYSVLDNCELTENEILNIIEEEGKAYGNPSL